MGSADSTAAPPVIAGHYRIVELLGEGGWARVYRATDLNLQREVALKRLRPDRLSQPGLAHRLMREARTASRLSHPGIVPVFDAFEHDGTAWIVMELVDGVTLREVLQLRGALPLEEILRYAEELTSALGAAHAAGLLHRDVTPRNVLISRDGRARLTDFGLACGYVTAEDASQAPTASTASALGGRTAGTPGYMSPEQLLGRPLDPRSDLFCLGVLLYEMCTGRAAFASATGGDLYDAVLHHEPMTIGRLNYEIPEELERIIHKAMAKRPDERYQGAGDMLSDLRHLRRSIESVDTLPVAAHPPRRGKALLRIAAGAAAVLALAAGLALLRQRIWPGAPPPPPVPRQVTTFPGWEGRPALSPDGDLVAYVSDQSGNQDIWLADADGGGTPLRLTDDPAVDDTPAWYPDGRSLAFVSQRGGTESIWKVARLGGPAILVLPNAIDPAVSPDGTRIAFARKNGAGAYRIGVASLSSPGSAALLTGDKDGAWDHLRPAWSPDGREIVYEDFRDLWIVPAAGGPARKLTSGEASDHDPVWSPAGRFLYFDSYREGTLALWRVSAAGGEPERMTLGTGPETQPSVSRDGSRLAYSTYARNPDIVLLDLAAGTRQRISGASTEDESAFAPDGRSLLFVSDRLGRSDLWLQPLAAGGTLAGPVRRFSDLPGGLARPGYSPDGAYVAVHRVVHGERDIWILPLDGGPAVRFTGDPAQDFQPSWSPAGSEIAFISNRDGQDHVWIAPVSGGRPAGPARRLSAGSGTDMLPVWSPDAQQIAFMRTDDSGTDIWALPASGAGDPRRVTKGAEARYLAADEATGALLVAGTWGTEKAEIRRVDPDSGRVTPMTPPLVCGGRLAECALALSRDGRTLAFMIDEDRGDLWVLKAAPGTY